MNFLEFYLNEYKLNLKPKKSWRDRYVYHVTPTGQRNRVLIRSLPAPEQEKYRPPQFKKGGGLDTDNKLTPTKKPVSLYTYDFYIGVESNEALDNLEEGTLVKATNDSGKAIDFEDLNLKVIKIFDVPIKAVVKYKTDEDEWKEFDEDMSEKDKYNFIKFEDQNKMFLLKLEPYLDVIKIGE